MSFLLDTDICSAHLRRPSGLSHRFIQHSGHLHISCVSLGELYSGAYHVSDPQPLLDKIYELLRDVTTLDFDPDCALEFGKVRGKLLRQGISVPTADLTIAVTALVYGFTLVTHNTADYRHIPGLKIADWLVP
jgi:tRNA(fMet)-specific endonuclease VapC